MNFTLVAEAMQPIKALFSAILALLIAVGAVPAAAAAAHYRHDHGYALNDLHVSPGAIFPVGIAAICRKGYATSVRHVTETEEARVYDEYGIVQRASGQYEMDHVIPLELGGDNAPKNLWPEPNDHPRGYLNSKDRLENRLHSLVCGRRVSLLVAQRAIATDWAAAYRRFLGTWPVRRITPSTTTTPATNAVPVTTRVVITSLPTRIAPGSMAWLTAHSPRARDTCNLTVQLPSRRFSESAGLGTASANAQGVASWTWKIGGNTGAGTATAIVSCGAGVTRRTFRIL